MCIRDSPIIDLKLDIARHPAARLTPEGGAPPYEHGACPLASAAVAPVSYTHLAREIARAAASRGVAASMEPPPEGKDVNEFLLARRSRGRAPDRGR